MWSREPSSDLTLIQSVEDYVETHFGKVETVYHERKSEYVHLDVFHALPTSNRPYHTLMSAGMSSKAMRVPAGVDPEWSYGEVVLHVTPQWTGWQTRTQESFWPIALLRQVALYPHRNRCWIAPAHSIPLGYEQGHILAPFSVAFLWNAPLQPCSQWGHRLKRPDYYVASLALLYQHELELIRRSGMEAFMEAAIQSHMGPSDILVASPNRQPILKIVNADSARTLSHTNDMRRPIGR